MSKQYVGVRELHRAAQSAGYTMGKLYDPSQGRNEGWGLFLGGEYVKASFSFKIEPVSEALCRIGRAQLATREIA